MLVKILSGAQTGADIGGLIAAKEAGLATGGWVPQGFLTEDGDDPTLGERFGVVETPSRSYFPRTYANVRDADATIYFASNWSSPGTKATLKAVEKYGRLSFLVDLREPKSPGEMAQWLIEKEVKVLNVAGHRESVHPGVAAFVVAYLGVVFKILLS
jgi:hypothetical protein